jgi:hypothetical protein
MISVKEFLSQQPGTSLRKFLKVQDGAGAGANLREYLEARDRAGAGPTRTLHYAAYAALFEPLVRRSVFLALDVGTDDRRAPRPDSARNNGGNRHDGNPQVQATPRSQRRPLSEAARDNVRLNTSPSASA